MKKKPYGPVRKGKKIALNCICSKPVDRRRPGSVLTGAADMRDVSEESLLDYFHSTAGNSGRVRNADILKTFKPFIGHSDLPLRGK